MSQYSVVCVTTVEVEVVVVEAGGALTLPLSRHADTGTTASPPGYTDKVFIHLYIHTYDACEDVI